MNTKPSRLPALALFVSCLLVLLAPCGWCQPTTNGLQLWLKVDAGVTKDGDGLVSVWADQSGHANDATQSVASSQPLFVTNAFNGQPAIRFDGQNDRLNFTPIDASNFTVFVVFKMTGHKYWSGPLNNRVSGKT